jgi:hypothetical protein
MQTDTMPLDSAPPPVLKKDGSGNILSDKRTMRRNLGWPSGRQWRKWRKQLQRAMKEAQTV